MKMSLNQAKLVELTMELDLRTREYKKLCDKLEQLKEKGIDSNNRLLMGLQQAFQKNHNDIVKINKQIKKIKETEERIEEQKVEYYNPDNLFKNEKENKKQKLSLTEIKKKNIFMRIWDKIRKIIQKN